MYGGGSNPLNPNWIRRCLNMYANAQTFLLHYTWECNSYVLQKIYGTSCLMNFGPSCLINLGRVGKGRVLCGPSWFWAELSVIPVTFASTNSGYNNFGFIISAPKLNFCIRKLRRIVTNFIYLRTRVCIIDLLLLTAL